MMPVDTFNVFNLGWMDFINILIRIGILFFVGVVGHLTLNKRFYAMTIFLTGTWLTFFRLTMLRAILLYVGVFSPIETDVFVSQRVYNFFQSSVISNIMSGIVLIGSILLFTWIKNYYSKEKEGI